MAKPEPRISTYADCTKLRDMIDQGKAQLARRRTNKGLELIAKSSSGAFMASIDRKFEPEFSTYAGRWGKA